MCRIAGIIDRSSDDVQQHIITMRDAMKHGGPDSEGVYVDENVSLALGHRRLSIIDLSDAGKQPMKDRSGNIILVFNGEIYNYRELKKDLEAAGYQFVTESDSEVIINAYLHWEKPALPC